MWVALRNPVVLLPQGRWVGVGAQLTHPPHRAIVVLLGAVALVVLLGCMIRPLWGVCLAALLDLYFSYVQTFGLPPRNYLLAYLLGLLVLRTMGSGVRILPKSAYRLALATGFLLALVLVRSLISSGGRLNILYGLAGGLGAGLAIAAVTARFVEGQREAYTFIRFVTIGLLISSVVALLQFIGVESAWHLRELLGVDESVVSHQIRERGRVPGLTYFAIQLSYQLVTVIPLVGSIWLAPGPGVASRQRYGVACATMALGLAVTLTRSGIGAAMAGIAAVILRTPGRRRWLWLGVMGLAAAVIIGIVDLEERRGVSVDQLSADRLPHFITALWIAWDNPLGIGSSGQFTEYAAYYYSEVADLPGAELARTQTAHNQFLNVLVVLGIPGLIGLVWFYYELVTLLARIRRRLPLDSPVRAVAVGLTGAFVAYIVNSSFHNGGPFSSDPFNWYWIGLTVALARMAERDGGTDERGPAGP
jgi:hypothetical protein